jgi:transcriptional regulator with XRE-family HTH domain
MSSSRYTVRVSGEHATAKALGEFIRAQRELAHLSLRQLGELASVSNPYLSQIERGLYKPSAEVLKGIADALGISAKVLYSQAGLLDDEGQGEEPSSDVEQAIRLDRRLTTQQKEALIGIYRELVGSLTN